MGRIDDMPRWRLILARTLRQAWVRAALYCLGGILTALFAWRFQFNVSEELAIRVGADAVGNVLGILASSMLTVTTFSLTVLVNALGSASAHLQQRRVAKASRRRTATMVDLAMRGASEHGNTGTGLASGAAAQGTAKAVTTQSFAADVLAESQRRPVVVHFLSARSEACKGVQASLEHAAKARRRLKFHVIGSAPRG